MVFTLVVVGIATFLLLLGTVIPQLRGNVTEIRDLEFPDGITVRFLSLSYIQQRHAPQFCSQKIHYL